MGPGLRREAIKGSAGRARRPILAARKVHFEIDLLGAGERRSAT
jgi:hypothetical protein